jgi:hypothetical protein
MSYTFVDIQYVNRITSFVRNFKKKNDNLWNCSCPICGDSDKNKTKARMYFMRKNNTITVYCHNCHYSRTFSNFLKEINYDLYKEYVLEKYKQGASKKYHHVPNPLEVMKEESFAVDNTKFDILFNRIDRLPKDNVGRKYVEDRLIPENCFEILYYSDNVLKIAELFPQYKNKIPAEDSRLIIPIYNKQRKIWGISARAIENSKYRYLNYYADDKSNIIYGLERHNKTKETFVTEGPLDSLFLPNCLASLNANLLKVEEYVNLDYTTFIFDNQPRNKEVCNQIHKTIEAGCNVVIWDKNFTHKDINAAVINGVDVDKLLAIIRNRTYNKLSALTEFNEWRKVEL